MQSKKTRGVSKKSAFLAAFAVTASISAAALACKIDRRLHYRWLKEDPDYPARFNEVRDEAAQMLEDEAVRRANEGVAEPVVYQGALCFETRIDAKGVEKKTNKPLVIRRYADALLMFLLRGMRPEKYRERFSAELTGPNGGPLQIVERLKAGRDRIAKKR